MAVLGKETVSNVDEMVARIREPEIATSDLIGKRPAKVLVVDDDPDICQLLSAILNGNDFQVQAAMNGYEGLKKAHSSKPDLVILDVMMPGIDGFETFRRLQGISNSPVLFLSARHDVGSVALALENGAADYVNKPFSNRDLISKVAFLLDVNSTRQSNRQSPNFQARPRSKTSFSPKLPSFAKLRTPASAYTVFKGIVDLVGGLIGSALVALVFLPVAVLIRLESRGPILFRQVRIGANGKPFRILKFRTMNCSAPAYAQKGKESVGEYVSPLGRVLRHTLIDELPQFINVLRGEMSLVGPRPELPNIVGRYSRWERERLTVKPGITGWWQINGMRQPMSAYSQLDVDYVRHRSLTLDLYIIWMTVLMAIRSVVSKKEGKAPLSEAENEAAHSELEPMGSARTKKLEPR